MGTGVKWVVVVVALSLVAAAACGADETLVVADEVAPSTIFDPSVTCLPVVDASEVIVSGDLDVDQRETVDWALGRFALAGLRLPERLEIGFDPTRVACDGKLGRCDPNGNNIPTAWVCEAEGTTVDRELGRRVTLLHELGHIWHWTLGDGEVWLDLSPVVGGAPPGSDTDGIPSSEQSEERVAMVVAWGLLDQKRRHVGSAKGCSLLYEEFRALTGVDPLGPLEPVCLPDG